MTRYEQIYQLLSEDISLSGRNIADRLGTHQKTIHNTLAKKGIRLGPLKQEIYSSVKRENARLKKEQAA